VDCRTCYVTQTGPVLVFERSPATFVLASKDYSTAIAVNHVDPVG
jgi:hypothetical protein